MIRAARALVLFLALAANAWAQTPPVTRIVAVSPDPADQLAGGQNLSVRVAYETDLPLRFKAAGYREGKKHESLATNPSPVYPAGKGEAVVWVFGQPGAKIDELRVHVCDASWKQISEVAVPCVAETLWVVKLSSAQQRSVQQVLHRELVTNHVKSTV